MSSRLVCWIDRDARLKKGDGFPKERGDQEMIQNESGDQEMIQIECV